MRVSEHCEGCFVTSLTIAYSVDTILAGVLVPRAVATTPLEFQTAIARTRIVSAQLHSRRSVLLQPRNAVSIEFTFYLWIELPFLTEKFEATTPKFAFVVNHH